MIVVVTSFSNREDAERVSNILVVERLAACVHILAPHLAVYEWKGEIRREEEVNILIKTDDRLYSVVEERLKELHPYEIPLIFCLQADYTSAEYAAWVNLQTGV
jgi:periplasmic divalent cation tolerance protein